MIYADYDFYLTEYDGSAIEAEDFTRLAKRASDYIDYLTFNRAQGTDDERIGKACCAIAEQYMAVEAAERLAVKTLTSSDGSEVQSQTVGAWTKSYRSGGESAVGAGNARTAAMSALADIAYRHLAPTGLLYRGRRCGRCSHTL